jgi:hypothetical protein
MLFRLFGAGFVAAIAVLGSRPSLLAVAAIVTAVAVVLVRRGAGALLRVQHLDAGEAQYRCDGDERTVCAPGRSATTAYRVMHGFREGRQSFLLYSPELASIIPSAPSTRAISRGCALLDGRLAARRPLCLSHLVLFGSMSAAALALIWTLLARGAGAAQTDSRSARAAASRPASPQAGAPVRRAGGLERGTPRSSRRGWR